MSGFDHVTTRLSMDAHEGIDKIEAVAKYISGSLAERVSEQLLELHLVHQDPQATELLGRLGAALSNLSTIASKHDNLFKIVTTE